MTVSYYVNSILPIKGLTVGSGSKKNFNGENGFMAEKTELNGRARYYYGKEQDFTGKTEFYGRAGFYGSERDFTGENGILR